MSVICNGRPVSGEIMIPSRPVEAGWRDASAIADADFETIAPQSASGPGKMRSGATKVAGLDMLVPGNGKIEGKQTSGSFLFWCGGVLMLLCMFWFAGGHAVLRNLGASHLFPQPVSIRFEGVESRIERGGRRPLLIVDGTAVNDGQKAIRMPSIAITVSMEDGRTTRYLLGTSVDELSPGAGFPFSGRLIAPEAGVRSVSVSFEPLH